MGLLGISTACRFTLLDNPVALNFSPQIQSSVSSPAAKRYGCRPISTGQEQVFQHECARRYAIADNEIGFDKRLIITPLCIILVPFCARYLRPFFPFFFPFFPFLVFLLPFWGLVFTCFFFDLTFFFFDLTCFALSE